MPFVCKLWLKSNHAWRIDTLWFDNIGNSREFPRNSHKLRNSQCYHWEFPREFPVNWGIPNDMEKKGGGRKSKGGRCGVEKGRRAWYEGRKRGGRLTWEQQYTWSHTWGHGVNAWYFSLFNQQTTGFNRNMPKMVHKMPWRIFVYQYGHI